MSNLKMQKIIHKIQDHMLVGSIYDNIMLKTKYRSQKLEFNYNVMIGQKHRLLFYQRLKRQYLVGSTKTREWEREKKKFNSGQVWFCWLQGLENAPVIVKRCYESLTKNLGNKSITILDKDNMFDYISLPNYIVEKWKKGIIGQAHFSDLVRLELLKKYGGYWIDTTVFCTDASITKDIDKQPLFMYSFYYFGFNPEIMETNNWFIHSTTNANILCLTQKMLYEYWKNNNRAVNYFIFHLFMTIACEFYDKEYAAMPIVSQANAHILATYIGEQYNQSKYEMLKKCTGFHKLSTRFSVQETNKKDTFYDYLIQGKLF